MDCWRYGLRGREAALVGRCALLLAVASPTLHLLRARRLHGWLQWVPDRRRSDGRSPAQVGAAVERAARVVPGAHCLAQGLVGEMLLRRRGVVAVLHIGVQRAGDGLAAHAWVEVEGEVVIGAEQRPGFEPLWHSP